MIRLPRSNLRPLLGRVPHDLSIQGQAAQPTARVLAVGVQVTLVEERLPDVAAQVLVLPDPLSSVAPTGIHDLERIVGVAHHFGIKSLVCINKYDLNLILTQEIEKYCLSNNIELVGKIPFDISVTEALVRGLPIVEYSNNQVTEEIKNLWKKILIIFKKDISH